MPTDAAKSQTLEQSAGIIKTPKPKNLGSDYEFTFFGLDSAQQSFLNGHLPEALANGSTLPNPNLNISLSPYPNKSCNLRTGVVSQGDHTDELTWFISVFKLTSKTPRYVVSNEEFLDCPEITDEGYKFQTTHYVTQNKGSLRLSPALDILDYIKPERCQPDAHVQGTVKTKSKSYKVDWPEAISRFSENSQSAQFVRCQQNGYAQINLKDEAKQKLALLNWSRRDVQWPDEKISEFLDNCDELKFCKDKGNYITLGPSIDIFTPVTFGVYRTDTKYGVMNFAYMRVGNSLEGSFITRSLDGVVITVSLPISDWTVKADENTEIDRLAKEFFTNITVQR